MSKIITDEMCETAAMAGTTFLGFDPKKINVSDDAKRSMRAALLAVLPDIGEAIAKAIEPKGCREQSEYGLGQEDALERAAESVRTLTQPPPVSAAVSAARRA